MCPSWFVPWLAGGGLGIGIAFGVVAQRSRFCVVSAFSNLVLMRDYRQLHAYLAALGVALVGTFALEWLDLVAIADTAYRRPSLNWLGALGGGLLFGLGAMLAGAARRAPWSGPPKATSAPCWR